MAGFENGAIKSIEYNRTLRRGSGQRFRGGLYSKGFVGGSTRKEQQKQSKLIERANEQRKIAIHKQLTWIAFAAMLVAILISYWLG